MSEEIILLGDPVCYVDSIHGANVIGVVTSSCMTNFKVLWNDETQSRVEVYSKLRLASLEEVDAQSRIVQKHSANENRG